MLNSKKSIHFYINRWYAFAILCSIFTISFVLSPYWAAPQSTQNRTISLFAIIMGGAIWSYFSSDKFSFKLVKKDLVSFGILTVIIGIINYNALISVIPWRGDEEFHFTATLRLVQEINRALLIPLFFAIIGFLFCCFKSSKWVVFFSISISVWVVYVLFTTPYLFDIGNLLRYPFFTRWFHTGFLLFVSSFGGDYHEFSYRIIPFLSVVFIAHFSQKKIFDNNLPISIIWAIAIATIPLIFYYSSILYLEMPGIFFMVIVSTEIKELLSSNYENIRKKRGWYALLLIGFIKETMVIFLFSFFCCRIFVQFILFWDKKKKFFIHLFDEFKIFFSVFFPLVLYLFYRKLFSENMRSYDPQFINLTNFKLYSTIGFAFLEQFGVVITLFLYGLISLFKRKEYSVFFFLILLSVLTTTFFATDQFDLAGYSRFNLLLAPALIAGAIIGICEVKQYGVKQVFLVIGIGLIIISNFILSPVNSDGTKKAYWGNYILDTSEHYYPYDKAISWLKEKYFNEKIMFTGMYYSYPLWFYMKKVNWQADYVNISSVKVTDSSEELKSLVLSMKTAIKYKYRVVIFHLTNKQTPYPEQILGFSVKKIIKNKAHSLIIYANL